MISKVKEIPKNAIKGRLQKQPSEVFIKKGILENFTDFIGKHLRQDLLFNKVVGLCEIFKNNFFAKHVWATASKTLKKAKSYVIDYLFFK